MTVVEKFNNSFHDPPLRREAWTGPHVHSALPWLQDPTECSKPNSLVIEEFALD